MPTALITGASKGIGRSIALRLADDGYDLVIHHRSSATEAQDVAEAGVSLGIQSLVVQADLTASDSSAILVEAGLERFGTIDVLVNSASMFEADGWEDATMQNIQSHMIVNVFAPLALTRAVAHAAEQAGADSGSISVVNILDQKLTNPNPDYISYTMSKQALEVQTRMLARALAPRLRVNAVSPGHTTASHQQSAAQFRAAQENSLLGFGPSPGDVADAVSFFCHTRSVTGQILTVDAGEHMLARARDVEFGFESEN
jgi:NAD(P)-dependent dehydrogenase (short-subunit alcohol dehydrogenase family)